MSGSTPEYHRQYYLRNKDRIAARDRERHQQLKEHKKNQARLRVYGISSEFFEGMRAAQGGLCAICGLAPKTLYVDHDHATNRVRGLLCHKCNTGIGMLGDSPDRLDSAKRYLLAHKEPR